MTILGQVRVMAIRLVQAYYNHLPPPAMIQFIKNAFFGSHIFQRNSSAEVQSKLKSSMPKKKPLSFDSKQKERQEAIKTSKRQQHPQVIVHDDTATIKKYSGSKDYFENTVNNRNFTIVSDAEDDPKSLKKGVVSFLDRSSSSRKGCILDPEEQSCREVPQKGEQSNKMEFEMMKSSILPQRSGRALVKRDRSMIKVRRIAEKCVICQKVMTLGDSFQLACSHRCHNECGIQMQWRFRFRCDACEIKKDHKRCSIILSVRRRKGHP